MNNSDKNTYLLWDNIQFIYNKAKHYAPGILKNFGIYSVCKSLSPVISVLTAKFILDFIINDFSYSHTIFLIAGIAACSLFVSALETDSWNRYWPMAVKVRFDLLTELGKKAMDMDFENTESVERLEQLQNARASSSDNKKGIAGFLLKAIQFIPAVIISIFCGVMIVVINPPLLIPVLLIAIIRFYAAKKYKRYEYEKSRELNGDIERRREIFGNIIWNFKFGKEIRYFNLSNLLSEKFKELSKQHSSIFTGIEKKKFSFECFAGVLNFILELFMYLFLIIQESRGELAISDFLMVTVAIRNFSVAMTDSLNLAGDIWKNSMEINDYRSFMDLKGKLEQIQKKEIKTVQSIEFQHVSFQYPGSEQLVLKDISFQLKANERIALVGMNGSGKTTMIKLLIRLYDPSSGKILINGIDRKEFDRNQYYQLFSVMFQDTHIYAFPLIENITMQKTEQSDYRKTELALRTADLWTKAEQLPYGVDTMMLKLIDDNGVEFSGGENQKLAFARAVYKNAPVIIMDEPTASLDAFSEDRMFQSIENFTKNKMGIFISHRLSSVKFCDHILFIENGSVVECGNHASLMKQHGKYYNFYKLQADLYSGEESKC